MEWQVVCVASVNILVFWRLWGTTSYDDINERETEADFVYEMDWQQQSGEPTVEIRHGHALRVNGGGNGPVQVKLRRNHEMKLSRATASMSPDGVLTVVIPKRHGPRKWYEYTGLALNRFKTVRVPVSTP